MRKYVSIYKEASKLNKIVNISKLQWKKSNNPVTWIEANENIPSGYRLPTIQELYSYVITIYDKDDKSYNAKDCFWSSTEHPKTKSWAYYTSKTEIFVNGKELKNYVMYVK